MVIDDSKSLVFFLLPHVRCIPFDVSRLQRYKKTMNQTTKKRKKNSFFIGKTLDLSAFSFGSCLVFVCFNS